MQKLFGSSSMLFPIHRFVKELLVKYTYPVSIGATQFNGLKPSWYFINSYFTMSRVSRFSPFSLSLFVGRFAVVRNGMHNTWVQLFNVYVHTANLFLFFFFFLYFFCPVACCRLVFEFEHCANAIKYFEPIFQIDIPYIFMEFISISYRKKKHSLKMATITTTTKLKHIAIWKFQVKPTASRRATRKVDRLFAEQEESFVQLYAS